MNHPERSASWLSRLLYRWAHPLVQKGYQPGAVSQDDLYPLLPQDRRGHRADAFLALTARPGTSAWGLCRFALGTVRRRFLLGTLLQGLAVLASLASPWLLNRAMTDLGGTAPLWEKLGLALALTLSVLASGLLAEHALQLALKSHIPLRRLFTEALLAKVLRIGGKAFDDRAGGRVQNLINKDVWDVSWMLAEPLSLLFTLLQLIGTVALLVWQVGEAGLVGCAVLALLLIGSSELVRRMNRQERVLKQRQDERNGILAEYIKKLRLVRQNGLGPFFIRRAEARRAEELTSLRRILRLDALHDTLSHGAALLVTLATFATYLLAGQALTMPQVFTTIALFAVLRMPMMRLPHQVRLAINFNTAIRRVTDFLDTPEQHRVLDDPALPAGALVLEGVGVRHQDRTVLQNVDLRVTPGEIIGITGETGSGKSCLLHLIAGFDDDFSGSLRRAGQVGLLGHKPWLMNDTLRNNILFGQPWDEARYQWVLGASALETDLALLAHGDQTLVGELGTRLSGGQQQRVALARALYTRADILLLDNPLSALDPLVAEQVLARGLTFRPGPTRLLVSHDPRVLARCDRVFAVRGGALVPLPREQVDELPLPPPLPPTSRADEAEQFSDETVAQGGVDWGLLGFLWRQVAAPAMVLGVVLLTVLQEGLRIGSDLWLGSQGARDAATLLTGYALLGGGALLALALGRVLDYRLALRLAWRLFQGMLGRISRAPMAFFDKVPQGRILNRFDHDLGEAQEALISMMTALLAMGVTILLQMGVIGSQMPLLLPLFALLALALYRLQRGYRRVQLKLRRYSSVLRSPLYVAIGETIRGAPSLRLAGAERFALDQVLTHFDRNLQSWYTTTSINRWLGIHQTLVSASLVGSVALLVAFGASPLIGGLAITYAFTTSSMLNALIRTLAEVEQVMNAVERVREYSEIETERAGGERLTEPHPVVRFEGVGLRYPEAPQWALREVSFTLGRGEKVGVCGRTGAGKSSLLGLLQAMYPAAEGEILFAGHPLSRLDPEAVRSLFDTVSQTPLTFFGSLRENLAPLGGQEEATLLAALDRVGLADRCLGQLDQPLDALQLSAGETQLLVLARILLSRRPLIVLDEATSDLDPQAMARAAELLYRWRGEASFLVIAHHLAPLLAMDRVIVMEAGRVVEQGSPVALLANPSSRFARLFATQQEAATTALSRGQAC